jgi:hypothetical protein
MLIPKLKPIGTIITLCIVSLLSPVSYFSTHSHAVGASAAILSQTPAATKLELPVPSGPFELVQMKLTRAEFNTIILRQQKIQNEVLASVRGGSYRVTMIDMPGISHRSFSDLTLMSVIGDATNGADSLHNYQIIQSYTRAFFDKYLKSQKDSLLDQKSSLDPLVRVDRFSPAAQ